MRIKWGFLTRLSVLAVAVTAAAELRGQTAAPDESKSLVVQPSNQVPLASGPSFGWSENTSKGQEMPNASPFEGYPVAPAMWPPAPASGMFPAVPCSVYTA